MQRVTVWLATFVLWNGLASAEPPLTPGAIAKRIADVGLQATLDQIYENGAQRRELLSGVASGTEEWLKVGVELYRASDAGTSTQLKLAAGEALEHQPRAVLEIVGPALGIDSVCGGPDVDDKRYDSYNLSIKAIEKRKEMLRTVADPQLIAIRDQCIRKLEASKSGIARFYGVDG